MTTKSNAHHYSTPERIQVPRATINLQLTFCKISYAFNFRGKLKMYITHTLTPHREDNFTGKHNFTHTPYREDNFTGKLRRSSSNRRTL